MGFQRLIGHKHLLIVPITLFIIFGIFTAAANAQPVELFSTNGSVYYLPPGVPQAGGRIHSNYTTNTDSCAACHFTHTAFGPRLLQWTSAYQACVACHDGTLGNYTYDVFAGKIGQTGKRTAGGLFGDNMHISNSNNGLVNPDTLSNHMPDGSVSLASAPGGNPEANHNEALECISCHTPHGQGGNARILNPDPNKLLFKKGKEAPNELLKWLTPLGGNQFKAPEGNWIPGYPYNHLTKVMVAPDEPFLAWSELGTLELSGGTFLEAQDFQINYRDGVVTLTEAGLAKKDWQEVFAIYVPGLYIVMQIDNYMDLLDEQVTYLATDSHGRPTSFNRFCGVCHTDYNTEDCFNYNEATGQDEPHNSGELLTGTYSIANRHQVGNKWDPAQWSLKETPEVMKFSLSGQDQIITCMTCHLAHGADKEYWNDTNDSYPGFPDDIVDNNPSSALKRLPNMAVCEACHQMGDGSEGYRTIPW